ncbi:MAG: VacJ family lipoprotein [Paludibacterium sp.]|uniref:MlaA family lipoprotein n=1 Tax=Paludibacterium sp. TaxID=1917523 RepID=UPI0025E4079F|nr:VacJ family lipoprotein [Paludibacterium sp.]MBV8045991.1 VacJ family lipoprotein [Paludibacterium sp.]MBV8647331.1 VacJ family lipoprotein [Paludibacterium sp.]
MKAAQIAVLSTLLLATGCATHPSNPQDPLEPFNRSIYTFNDKLDRAVAKPVAKAYRQVTPQPVRTGVNNFFDNLLDAYSFVNDVLSVQPVKAMNDLMRVAVNTTFGVFGLVDFATPMGLQNNKTTLGDTLARWGWKDSSYLVLPVLGPSTVRDGLGTATTLYVGPERRILFKDPATANTAAGLLFVSKRERLLDVTDAVDEAAIDPYSYTRDAFLQLRAAQIRGSQASAPAAATPAADDMDIDQLVAPDAAPSSAPASVKPDASAPR